MAIEQLAGETPEQHLERLESELVDAERELKRANDEAVAIKKERDNANAALQEAQDSLDFLRQEIADLALHLGSPSAPKRKSEMARLLQGWLEEQPWQHRTWRSQK